MEILYFNFSYQNFVKGTGGSRIPVGIQLTKAAVSAIMNRKNNMTVPLIVDQKLQK